MKDNGKPSLEDLFSSKKLDMPDDKFWNRFQNDVKGKAIAGASRKPLLHNSKLLISVLPVFVLAVFLSRPIFQQELQTASAIYVDPTLPQLETSDSFNQLAIILREESVITPQFSLPENKVGNKTAFSDTRLSLTNGDEVFAQYHYHAAGDSELSVPTNFTF
jgi:hypothetical protein